MGLDVHQDGVKMVRVIECDGLGKIVSTLRLMSN